MYNSQAGRITAIFAVDLLGGMGYNGRLPWHNSTDLQHFKKATENNIVIMGRKTHENMPALSNRVTIVVGRNGLEHPIYSDSHFYKIDELDTAIAFCKQCYPDKEIFIIGGANLLFYIFNTAPPDRLLISFILDIYKSDTVVPYNLHLFLAQHDMYYKSNEILQLENRLIIQEYCRVD